MYYKTRSQFLSSDYTYMSHVFGHSESERTAIISLSEDPECMSSMLRKPELFQSILKDHTSILSVSPQLYFYCLIYQALNFKQIADDDVTDYVSGVCVEFTQSRSLWRFATDSSERMIYFVDLQQVFRDLNEVQQYYLHQYIGNAALFLTGFFPDRLFQREKRNAAPSIGYYENLGESHFEAAASSSVYVESDVTPILHKLSEYFTEVRSAINVYVDTYVNLHNPTGVIERIERQSETLDEESFRSSLVL